MLVDTDRRRDAADLVQGLLAQRRQWWQRRRDVLAVLGAIREVIGRGTLFSGIETVFGDGAKAWVITVVPDYHGFLLAILPPGAFITLGCLIAGKNWLNQRAAAKANSSAEPVDGGCTPAAHAH